MMPGFMDVFSEGWSTFFYNRLWAFSSNRHMLKFHSCCVITRRIGKYQNIQSCTQICQWHRWEGASNLTINYLTREKLLGIGIGTWTSQDGLDTIKFRLPLMYLWTYGSQLLACSRGSPSRTFYLVILINNHQYFFLIVCWYAYE